MLIVEDVVCFFSQWRKGEVQHARAESAKVSEFVVVVGGVDGGDGGGGGGVASSIRLLVVVVVLAVVMMVAQWSKVYIGLMMVLGGGWEDGVGVGGGGGGSRVRSRVDGVGSGDGDGGDGGGGGDGQVVRVMLVKPIDHRFAVAA